jgi:hypothetical protein
MIENKLKDETRQGNKEVTWSKVGNKQKPKTNKKKITNTWPEMTSETCPRNNNMARALFVWARTGLKIRSLLNAHTKHEHFGRRVGHALTAAETLGPDA